MDEYIYGIKNHSEYLNKFSAAHLASLRVKQGFGYVPGLKRKYLKDLLSKEYLSNRKTTVGFPDFTDKQYLTDDNRKYMKMYRWLSPFYDITKKMVERFWSHHRIAEMRRQLMDKLEWRNALSVLCVSVGTGRDFDFIPKQIDIRSLQICGIDINVEMMKRCRRKWNCKLDLTLVR